METYWGYECSSLSDNQIGCLFNNAIQWLACCEGSTNVIVVFDLTEKCLH